MSREHRTKRIIKKHLRTDEAHEKDTREEIDQVRSSREDHSVKTNVSKKTRRDTSLFLSLRQNRRDNKTR